MKWCPQCKQWKSKDEFGRNRAKKDGLTSECKECNRANSLRYTHSPRGQLIKKIYNGSPVAKEKKRQYEKTEKGQVARRRNLDKFPEKRKARRAINNAIRDGKFPHISTHLCHLCGSQAVHYHHHKGYTKEHWLDVIPVCEDCHIELDKVQVQ